MAQKDLNGLFPNLPALPLYRAIMANAGPFERQEALGKRLGISDKSIRQWGNFTRPEVQFNHADKVLCHIGLNWWEVWDEDTTRLYAFVVRTYKPARPRGRQGGTKLTDEQVAEIRASDEMGAALARRYGVGKSTIVGIRNGQKRNTDVIREVIAAKAYGDLGPDLEALERVAYAFTGEGMGQQLELAA